MMYGKLVDQLIKEVASMTDTELKARHKKLRNSKDLLTILCNKAIDIELEERGII